MTILVGIDVNRPLIFSKCVIGSDHAGFALKQVLLSHAQEDLGLSIKDLGTYSTESVDYPDYANKVSEAILNGEAEFGILVCGTGIGISMAANRHKGIRAAVCNDGATASSLTRRHNDANILCLGGRLVGEEVARDCLTIFVTTPFEGGRHVRRVEKLG